MLSLTDASHSCLCRLQPKYIRQLMEKAEHRKQEQDIIYERKLRKEREQEDHLYGDKDMFVTTSYKEKLMKEKKWQEEQAKKDALDGDITQKKNAMFSFYSGLLDRRNVAAGAVDDALARDAERKREEERKMRQEAEERERQEKERVREAREREESDIQRGKDMAREARRRSSADDSARERSDIRRSEDRGDAKRKHGEEQDKEEEPKKKRKGAVIDLPVIERPKAIMEAPKRNDDASVQAARDRFLARKARAKPSTTES